MRNDSARSRSRSGHTQHRVPEELPKGHDLNPSANKGPRSCSRNDTSEATRSAFSVSMDQSREWTGNLSPSSQRRQGVLIEFRYPPMVLQERGALQENAGARGVVHICKSTETDESPMPVFWD